MTRLNIKAAIAAGSLALLAAAPLHAELSSISGVQTGTPPALSEVTAAGNSANVAISLAHGFPIWYKDTNNLKLELCLDQTLTSQGGGTFHPCLTAEPFSGSPISFPTNFGPEAFYWAAVAVDPALTSRVNGTDVIWNALLVLGQEAAFANELTAEGNQGVFSRIRVRISVPAPGTYRVTHPYGTRDYVVSGLIGGREINQTQDVGIAAGDTFLTSLSDGLVPPPFPQPTPPSLPFGLHDGIIDQIGRSIGPFLTPTAAPIVATNGYTYLADTGTLLAHNEIPINPGPFGNAFTIELIGDATGNIGSIPAGVVLNPAPGAINPQLVRIDKFQVSGKLFKDGPNAIPIAQPVDVSTSMNTSVTIDVVQSVADPISGANVHGINPQAIGVFVTPTDIRRSSTFTTPNGATVRRFINTSTGKATLTYTPATDFTGRDSFQYVVQDTGGLISTPETVTVTVENLSINTAVFRPKFGKWRIEGTSSSTASNRITLASDPLAVLTGSNESPPVSTNASGVIGLVVDHEGIDYTLNVLPLPASSVSAVHIHYGQPGDNGPILFTLYDGLDGPFATHTTGRLNFSNLQQRAEFGILTFSDAVNAVMDGNTYVNVHTGNNPTGELRGQLLPRTLGTATVKSDGIWSYRLRSTVNPLGVRGINAISSNGVRLLGIPLSIR